jgi:hypothetical protein
MQFIREISFDLIDLVDLCHIEHKVRPTGDLLKFNIVYGRCVSIDARHADDDYVRVELLPNLLRDRHGIAAGVMTA